MRSILLRDAPVVLGLATWQRLQEEAGQSAFLRHALEHWVEVGWIEAARVEPLARLLLGALMQAALAIGEAGDRGAELDRYRSEVRSLLKAIRRLALHDRRRAVAEQALVHRDADASRPRPGARRPGRGAAT